MKDVTLMARKLALHHVQHHVDANFDEADISSSQAYSGCGQSFVDNTGGDEFGAYGVRIGGRSYTKVVVERVCNIEGPWVYSLHELYLEAKRGQLTLV